MVSKQNLGETTWGTLPLDQAPPFAALVGNPNDAVPGSAGGNPIHDLPDGVDPQDPATVAQLGSGGGSVDLITGDSATFETTLGDWLGGGVTVGMTTYDPVLTWETGEGWPDPSLTGALQVVFDHTGESASIELAGPFVAGRTYAGFIVVRFPEAATEDGSLYYVLGGGGDQSTSGIAPITFLADRWGVALIRWKPDADQPVANLYISCSSLGSAPTLTVQIGRAGAALLRPQDRLAFDVVARPVTNATAFAAVDGLVVFPGLSSSGTRISTGNEDDGLVLGPNAALIGLLSAVFSGAHDTVGIELAANQSYRKAEHPAGDLAEQGYADDVGEGYLTTYKSQKDATTVQKYAAAGITIEHVDREDAPQKTVGAYGSFTLQSGARVIGPIPVAWDDPGLDPETGSMGALIGDELPVDTLVLGAWYEVTEDWVATDSGAIELAVDIGSIAGTNETNLCDAVGAQTVQISNGTVAHPFGGLTPGAGPFTHPVRIADTGVHLIFYVSAPGLSAGTANVYALVHYPG